MLKNDWRIVKSATKRGQWNIESRVWIWEKNADGRFAWTIAQNWTCHSVADSKRAALARVMHIRDVGERVTWSGGPIRLGVALIEADRLVTNS